MTVSEQLDKFIAENGGNERDALNAALARLDLAQRLINDMGNELERLRPPRKTIEQRMIEYNFEQSTGKKLHSCLDGF